MEKNFKRLLSLLVAVFMVVSMLPASVFAADESANEGGYRMVIYNEDGTEAMTVDGTKSASSFDVGSALADAYTFGDNAFLFGISGTPTYELVLLQDVEITEMVEISAGKNVVLDLNGYNITSGYQTNSTEKHIYPFDVYGNLTIKDSVGDGTISGRGIYVQDGATLTVESGTIYGIDANGGSALYQYGGDIVINGGSVEQTAEKTYNYAIYAGGGTVTVNGGQIVGKHGALSVSGAAAVVNGGELICTGNQGWTDNVCYVSAGSLTVNDGTFTHTGDQVAADSGAAVVAANNDVEIAIAGGSFTGLNGSVSGNSNTTISGGNFGTVWGYDGWDDLKQYVTPGATITVEGETYTNNEGGAEETFPAKIGSTGYDTLAEAIDAAQNGDTITVLANIELTEGLTVAADKAITLDLNGKTISGVSAAATSSAVITNKGTLTIQDSVGSGKVTAFAQNPDTNNIPAYANNTITNYGTLNIEGGIIENSTSNDARACFPIDNNSTTGNAVVNISGGTVTGRGAIRQFANSTTYENTVNITGGTVTGSSYAIWMQNPGSKDVVADMNISAGTVGKILLSPSANFDAAITGGTIDTVAYWEPDATNPDRNVTGFISGGTFATAISEEFLAEDFVLAKTPNGTYGVGTMPDATVSDLGRITVEDYDIYNGSSLSQGGDPIVLQLAMEFVANDTEEEARQNVFAEHTTDFFIQINGIEGGSFVADGCYLAGNYGTFGWIMIPLDGMTIEEGVIYPVISSVGFDFSYVDICTSVKDFKCGIYFTPEVLNNNPDMTVGLTLGLSESLEAAQSATFVEVDDYTYTVEDLKRGEPVAQIGTTTYTSLQDAVNAANGQTVTLLADVDLADTTLKIPAGTAMTLNLNGKTVSGVCNANQATMIHVANTADLTIVDDSAEQTGKITYAQGASNVGFAIHAEGDLILESGTIELTGSWSLGFAVDVRPNAWGTAFTEDTSFVMNGGKIVSSDTAVRVDYNSSNTLPKTTVTFIMNAGEIESDWDAVFVQHRSPYAAELAVVTINDGQISGKNSPLRIYGDTVMSDVEMNINGGTFAYTGEGTSGWIVENVLKGTAAVVAEADITVSGGIFQGDVSDYCADGYHCELNANGTYGIEEHNFTSVYTPATETENGFTTKTCDCGAVEIVPDAQDVQIDLSELEGVEHIVVNRDEINVVTGFESTSDNATIIEQMKQEETLANEIPWLSVVGTHTQTNAEGVVTKVTYEVTPMLGDREIEVVADITFRLAIDKNITAKHVAVFHELEDGTLESLGMHQVMGDETSGKYVVITNDEFSPYTVDAEYGVARIDTTYYLTLQDAIDAAEAGQTITVVKDIELTEGVVVAADKTITLDLNGKTVSMEVTDQITASNQLILNKGDLTITDSSAEQTGKISYYFNGTADRAWAYAVTAISNQQGTLTIAGGTIESLSTATNVYKFTVDNLTNGNGGDATVNVTGGTITAAKGGSIRGFANSTTNTCTINIAGGDILGQVWLQDPNVKANKGNMTITGGTITANAEGVDAVYLYGLGDASGMTVSLGGDVIVNGTTHITSVDTTAAFDVEITGGTYNDEVWTCTWLDGTDTAVPAISGGTFTQAVPEEYCAEGYIPVDNGNGTYGVMEMPDGTVAWNLQTRTMYTSVDQALAEVQAGQTVQLLTDCATTGMYVVIGADVTLDLNGYELTVTGYLMTVSATSYIVDNTNGDGLLKISREKLIVGVDYTADGVASLPVWIEEDAGYRISRLTISPVVRPDATVEGKAMVGFYFANSDATLIGSELADGKDDNDGLQLAVRVRYTNTKGSRQVTDIVITDKNMADYGAIWDTGAVRVYVNGLSTLSDITFEIVVSCDGVELSSGTLAYNP